jgi:hypothetical protein
VRLLCISLVRSNCAHRYGGRVVKKKIKIFVLFNLNTTTQGIKRRRENAGELIFFEKTGRKYSKRN